jgi:hypothetical protein
MSGFERRTMTTERSHGAEMDRHVRRSGPTGAGGIEAGAQEKSSRSLMFTE